MFVFLSKSHSEGVTGVHGQLYMFLNKYTNITIIIMLHTDEIRRDSGRRTRQRIIQLKCFSHEYSSFSCAPTHSEYLFSYVYENL